MVLGFACALAGRWARVQRRTAGAVALAAVDRLGCSMVARSPLGAGRIWYLFIRFCSVIAPPCGLAVSHPGTGGFECPPALGRTLKRRRYRLCLDRFSSTHHILILSEGDGRVLDRLLRIAARAEMEVIESSASIGLSRAVHRIRHHASSSARTTRALPCYPDPLRRHNDHVLSRLPSVERELRGFIQKIKRA